MCDGGGWDSRLELNSDDQTDQDEKITKIDKDVLKAQFKD
jgi:hypothetical protein